MKQRVGLTRSATATRPECVVVVEPTWDAIATAAANKFNKLSFKQIRRLVPRGVAIKTFPRRLQLCLGEQTQQSTRCADIRGHVGRE